MPVGDVPASVLPHYHHLIARHRQVELQLVRSFYKEQQKSPFKFLPWKNGALHFSFIPVSVSSSRARSASELAGLCSHTGTRLKLGGGRRKVHSRAAYWRTCTSTAACWGLLVCATARR